MEKVQKHKRMSKDVEKLSPHHQTSSVKAFHVSGFAVHRRTSSSHVGTLCRLYLAALRYNENASWPQATSTDGEPLFKVKVPKGRKSQCVARAVKTQPAYGYVDNLMEMILDKVVLDPAPLCADFDRPHKEDAVAAVVSAFNQAAV